MKSSAIYRRSIPVVIAAAVLTLAGCETMKSAWDSAWGSTKALFSSDNVTLSGSQVVPPVTTSGSGSGTIKVSDDKSVSGSIKTSGLDGAAAHIHVGAPGQNGPIAIPLAKGSDGTWSVPAGAKATDAQYQAYKAGNLYVNVHTAAHKGGEIRGQIKP